MTLIILLCYYYTGHDEKNPELLVSVGDVKMVIRKTKERKN